MDKGLGIMQRRVMLALRPAEIYETDLLKVALDHGVLDLKKTAQAVARVYEGGGEGFVSGFSEAVRSLIQQGALMPLRELPVKPGTEVKVHGPGMAADVIRHHPNCLAIKIDTRKLRYVMAPGDLERYNIGGHCPLVRG